MSKHLVPLVDVIAIDWLVEPKNPQTTVEAKMAFLTMMQSLHDEPLNYPDLRALRQICSEEMDTMPADGDFVCRWKQAEKAASEVGTPVEAVDEGPHCFAKVGFAKDMADVENWGWTQEFKDRVAPTGSIWDAYGLGWN